ncbi:MAG: hypothetical protein WA012_12555 [Rhodoferax sp.]|uniref:hypothetical protein n=1 Tax=Rhodoferax sp. TaxID=50421 RepID=UPI003BAFA33D
MTVENEFQKWATGFSGCDGGDIGSPDRRSVWVCGIEWGGGHDQAALKKHIQGEVSAPALGYEEYQENFAYIFNWQTMKLLSAMQGGSAKNYVEMAEKCRPFVKGSKGFFKMNLFPISFKDTGHQRWQDDFVAITGFNNKADYLAWCKRARFSVMRSWVAKFKPKVIVCFGKTFINDFGSAFVNGDTKFIKEPILNRELSWTRTQDGVLVAVCPFPVNRYGLNSDALLQAFGDRIGILMNGG